MSDVSDNANCTMNGIKTQVPEKMRLSKKYREWDEKRKRTLRVEEVFEKIMQSPLYYTIDALKRKKLWKRYLRMSACTAWLEFTENKDSTKSLTKTNFCRDRLCPMCQWRRSLKNKDRLLRVIDELNKEIPDLRFLFLTLTIRNCTVNNLRKTINLMSRSFSNMTKQKKFKNNIKGYFRSVEITRNKKNNTAHPHFHILLAVNEDYFKKARRRNDKSGYFTQKELTEMWKKSLKIDYSPSVDIRAVKKTEKLNSVFETTKYIIKTEDLVADPGWFLEYMFQISGLRFLSSGGILKDALKNLDNNLLEIKEKKNKEEPKLEIVELEKIYFNFNKIKELYIKAGKRVSEDEKSK